MQLEGKHVSPAFGAESGTTWNLVVYPDGYIEQHRGQVSLYLACNSLPARAMYQTRIQMLLVDQVGMSTFLGTMSIGFFGCIQQALCPRGMHIAGVPTEHTSQSASSCSFFTM